MDSSLLKLRNRFKFNGEFLIKIASIFLLRQEKDWARKLDSDLKSR